MKFSTTNIVAIASACYLLAAVAALALIMYGIHTSSIALTERITAIADKHAKQKTYREFSALLKSTQEERAQLSTFVLTEAQTSSFLTEIEQLGAHHGVELITDSLQVVEKEGSFNDLSIKYSIEGREDLVQKMIVLLETLPYHSKINTLSFIREESGSTKSNVELLVTLSKYEN